MDVDQNDIDGVHAEAGLSHLSKSTGIPEDALQDKAVVRRTPEVNDLLTADNLPQLEKNSPSAVDYDALIAQMPDGGYQERDPGISQEGVAIVTVGVVIFAAAVAYRYRPSSREARADAVISTAWVIAVLVFNFSMDTDMWRDANEDIRLFVLCASVPVLLLVSRPIMSWISRGEK